MRGLGGRAEEERVRRLKAKSVLNQKSCRYNQIVGHFRTCNVTLRDDQTCEVWGAEAASEGLEKEQYECRVDTSDEKIYIYIFLVL